MAILFDMTGQLGMVYSGRRFLRLSYAGSYLTRKGSTAETLRVKSPPPGPEVWMRVQLKDCISNSISFDIHDRIR
jgi:hypothetical protein